MQAAPGFSVELFYLSEDGDTPVTVPDLMVYLLYYY
jgi:hypothetical protein